MTKAVKAFSDLLFKANIKHDVRMYDTSAFCTVNVPSGRSITFDFREEGITGMIETGAMNHVWQMFPCQTDYRWAIRKIRDFS